MTPVLCSPSAPHPERVLHRRKSDKLLNCAPELPWLSRVSYDFTQENSNVVSVVLTFSALPSSPSPSLMDLLSVYSLCCFHIISFSYHCCCCFFFLLFKASFRNAVFVFSASLKQWMPLAPRYVTAWYEFNNVLPWVLEVSAVDSTHFVGSAKQASRWPSVLRSARVLLVRISCFLHHVQECFLPCLLLFLLLCWFWPHKSKSTKVVLTFNASPSACAPSTPIWQSVPWLFCDICPGMLNKSHQYIPGPKPSALCWLSRPRSVRTLLCRKLVCLLSYSPEFGQSLACAFISCCLPFMLRRTKLGWSPTDSNNQQTPSSPKLHAACYILFYSFVAPKLICKCMLLTQTQCLKRWIRPQTFSQHCSKCPTAVVICLFPILVLTNRLEPSTLWCSLLIFSVWSVVLIASTLHSASNPSKPMLASVLFFSINAYWLSMQYCLRSCWDRHWIESFVSVVLNSSASLNKDAPKSWILSSAFCACSIAVPVKVSAATNDSSKLWSSLCWPSMPRLMRVLLQRQNCYLFGAQFVFCSNNCNCAAHCPHRALQVLH